MKTHRPWQPHMSNTPLFNPYTPATGQPLTFDPVEILDEEADAAAPEELSPEAAKDQAMDQMTDPPPIMKDD
jgi:hypothetical protein